MRQKLYVLIFLIFAATLSAQEQFVVDSVTITIENQSFWGGSTRDIAVMRELGLRLGQIIINEEELTRYELLWSNRLRDLKVFVSGATIIVSRLETQDEQGRTPLTISIDAIEGWNLLGSPVISFDSNTGLAVGIRVRHFNLAGSLHPLVFEISYTRDADGVSRVPASVESAVSFDIGNHWYTLDYKIEAMYAQKYDFDDILFGFMGDFGSNWDLLQKDRLNLYFKATQGITVTGAAMSSATLLEENDAYFLTSGIKGGFVYKLLEVPGYDWLTYGASVGLMVNYRFEQPVSDLRRGLVTSFDQVIQFGEIRPVGMVFRDGILITLTNENSINSYRTSTYGIFGDNRSSINRSGYTTLLSAEAKGFKTFNEQFSVQGRSGIKYRPFQNELGTTASDVIDWGDTVRGVRDSDMRGDLSVYWNAEFQTKLWFGNWIDQLVQLHLVLFYDGGVMHSHATGSKWLPVQHGLGVELLIQPSVSRNIFIRTSFGFNVTDWFGGSPLTGPRSEIYVGSDLHF